MPLPTVPPAPGTQSSHRDSAQDVISFVRDDVSCRGIEMGVKRQHNCGYISRNSAGEQLPTTQGFFAKARTPAGLMQPNGPFTQMGFFFFCHLLYSAQDSSGSKMQEKTGTRLAYFATAQLVEYGQNVFGCFCLLVLVAGLWHTDESFSKSFRVCRCDKMLIFQNFHSWVFCTEEQKEN